MIPAGATISVALSGSTQYASAYGRQPDFELYEDYFIPDTVAELVSAFPGSINAGLVGGGSNVPALSDVAESIVLYQWDGVSPLVQDLDYVAWGTNTSSRVDKTGAGPERRRMHKTSGAGTKRSISSTLNLSAMRRGRTQLL